MVVPPVNHQNLHITSTSTVRFERGQGKRNERAKWYSRGRYEAIPGPGTEKIQAASAMQARIGPSADDMLVR
ncbi:hypothetical protein AAE478_001734 [Parahypoxylon ruwenzoriense]